MGLDRLDSRHVAGMALAKKRSRSWVLVALLLVWVNSGQGTRLVRLPEEHEALAEPLSRALAFFAMLLALIPLILLQIAVEARRLADKAG